MTDLFDWNCPDADCLEVRNSFLRTEELSTRLDSSQQFISAATMPSELATTESVVGQRSEQMAVGDLGSNDLAPQGALPTGMVTKEAAQRKYLAKFGKSIEWEGRTLEVLEAGDRRLPNEQMVIEGGFYVIDPIGMGGIQLNDIPRFITEDSIINPPSRSPKTTMEEFLSNSPLPGGGYKLPDFWTKSNVPIVDKDRSGREKLQAPISPEKLQESNSSPIAPVLNPRDVKIGESNILYSDILKLNKPESQPTQTYREIPSDATRLTAFPAQDQVVGVADFNQDGKRDLLLRNSSTGELQIWYMDAQYKIGEAPILYNASANHIANWVVEGVGDFNGDSSPDIVWRNLGQGGNTVFWLMNNHVLSQEVPASGAAPASIAAGWRIDAIADFNNDGKNDLVWRDYSTNSATSGKSFIWYMNNTSLISGNGGFAEIAPNQPVSLDWKIAGVADFNSDGVKDLFWHNSVTGQTAYWNMNAGYQSIANGYLFWTVASGWSIDTVGDINADNVADLVWKAPDGSHWFWSLNYSSTLNFTNGPLMIADANRLQANITSATSNFNADGFHSDFGYGMVNTSAAIAYLKNQLPATEIPDSIAFNLKYNNARQNEILNIPEVWAQGHTGQGITVAVIDSGVAIDHPALSGKIWTNSSEIIDGQDNDGNGYIDDVVGWDFTGSDADPSPDIWAANSHGTQVAGMVSAQLGALSNPSGSQVQGGAYGARIMPLKVTYNFGLNPTTNQFVTLVSETASANAVRYAADKGAKVINLSFGSTSFGVPNGATYLDAAVNYAISKGSVVVISAGNIPSSTFASWTTDNVYPAKLAGIPGVIAVGATNSGSQNYFSGPNQASQSAYFSIGAGSTQRNYVMAPGQNVLTTSRPLNPSDSNKVVAGYDYSYVNGTSFAAPLVAAAIANIRQAVPTATPAQITNAIIQTADSSDIYLWNA